MFVIHMRRNLILKKSLFLIPVVAFSIFTGVTNEASAQELKPEFSVAGIFDQGQNISSVYENAEVIENDKLVKSYTNQYKPIRYYKFYYDGSSGIAPIAFYSYGNHKLNVLNGNLIKVNDKSNTAVFNLTYGWNYVEIIQTAPMTIPDQKFEFKVGWDY